MRKDTPEKARKLLKQLDLVRMHTAHPVMGGFNYHELFDRIMENTDAQVTNYLQNALDLMERKVVGK